jgi:Glyoxalase-like domain
MQRASRASILSRPGDSAMTKRSDPSLSTLDPALRARAHHLVYATPDVDATVAALAVATGVHATPGGPHPGRGTRNALIALDSGGAGRCYLEIVGPDTEQPPPDGPRWFGIDELTAPRLATWAASAVDLDREAAAAQAAGVPLGPVRAGSRVRPDGVTLWWRFTDPRVVVAGGVVPFLIEWGPSPHPGDSAARGVALLGLTAEHPDPRATRAMLAAMGLPLAVSPGPAPALLATLRGQDGLLVLR